MSRSVSRMAKALAIVLLAAGLAGCSGEEPVVHPVVKKPVPKKNVAPPPAAAAAPDNAAVAPAAKVEGYDATGKRDPFLPFLRPRPKAVPRGDGEGSALQQADLGVYRFVGVIWNPRGYRALVEDTDGKGYTVNVGSRLGKGGATVTRITDRELVLKEEFQDYSGATVVRESSLKLDSAGGKR